jgi:hypothetical protein
MVQYLLLSAAWITRISRTPKILENESTVDKNMFPMPDVNEWYWLTFLY